jgi:uncharacterized membrane protein
MVDAIQDKEKIEAMKKLLNYITWIIILLPWGYAAIIWNKIPSRVALHFNLQGEADRHGNKTELLVFLFVLTAINIGTYLLIANVHRIDPRRYGKNDSGVMKRLAFAVALFLSALLCFFLYNAGSDQLDFFPGFIIIGTGILFCVLGNYFHTIKPNYIAGFRLPWTLEDPDNWKQTHQLAGKLWFAGGLVIIITGILLKATAAWIAYGAVLLILVIVPIIFSWQFFKKHRRTS